MHLEASFSFLGLPIQKLGMVEGQMGFSPTVRWPVSAHPALMWVVAGPGVGSQEILLYHRTVHPLIFS